jgi:hypothetical protein
MTFIVKFITVFGHVFYTIDTIMQIKECGDGMGCGGAMDSANGLPLNVYNLIHKVSGFF